LYTPVKNDFLSNLLQNIAITVLITPNTHHCRVDTSSFVITTLIGQCGKKGYSGDGGAATSALLNNPTFIIGGDAAPEGGFGSRYNMIYFISDTGNCAVRAYNHTSGIIIAFAGNGPCGYADFVL